MNQINLQLARDRVASELRKAILYGSFLPNQELAQDKIAEELGVSRMPVREALQMLAVEGLVTIRPNKCAIVNNITNDFIQDHFEIRSLLEETAVVKACKDAHSDYTKLWEYYHSAQVAINLEDYYTFNQFNRLFHEEIWRMSGNVKLEQMLSQLWNSLFVDSRAKEFASISNEEHGELAECIANHEPERARAIMKTHVQRSMQRILENKNSMR